MRRRFWDNVRLWQGDEERMWELFHENSKNSRYGAAPLPGDDEVIARMREMWESSPFEGFPLIEFPAPPQLPAIALEQALIDQHGHEFADRELNLGALGKVLHAACGVTRAAHEAGTIRSARTAPSAGGLYPLELFVLPRRLAGVTGGLFHYNPVHNHLRNLRREILWGRAMDALVEPDAVRHAAALVVITAMFERTTFKYNDRGYRFVLLEAGHVMQNLGIMAAASNLRCVSIGAFYDRALDDLIELDGLRHSVLCCLALGPGNG